MLWIKAFHIVFVVSWFAGLLYLPRLFVYHVETTDDEGHARFVVMEHKLFFIMTIAAILASILGIWLVTILSGYLKMPWMHAKLGLYVLLLGYHVWCWKLKQAFARGENTHTGRWYRLFNEIPAVILIGICILVVVKPF